MILQTSRLNEYEKPIVAVPQLAKLLDENSATGSNKDALTVGKDGWVSDSEKFVFHSHYYSLSILWYAAMSGLL